jgi:hypothetical protein
MIMPSNFRFRIIATTVAACACVVLIGTAAPAHAQMQVLGASPPIEHSAPQPVHAKRIVLHGVSVNANKLTIDPDSKAVLDYAARYLKKYPRMLVYVSGQGQGGELERQTQAVASYLRRRGVAADRLVVAPGAAPSATARAGNRRPGNVIVLNLAAAQPCGECS